jgi:hypothetical protein
MRLKISWTRKAMEAPEEAREGLRERLERLHEYFPEIRPRMTIGITRSYDGLAFMANDGTVKLMVDMHRSRGNSWKFPTYWTLGHELMHLAQFNTKGIPSGERACDIYALSRLPPRLIDDPPTYLIVPPGIRKRWHDNGRYAKLAHDLAIEAIIKRRAGLRRYASWWDGEFERRA